MDLVVSLISGNDLKNVNWRHGIVQAYAIVWIDSSRKFSTKVDLENGVNPDWYEKLSIAVPSTSDPKTATLYIDIVHANTPGTKPLIGSAKLPLSVILNEAQAKGKAIFINLNLERPSGRPRDKSKRTFKYGGTI
ncbi:Calcium-dependent lipid-binding (CaLB domain) family protein [Rhynchospora pubera]|uniref:Calcium-dependent lipid-binding (CaLB domain) family protein n=1 Tax=Rhynchospora pubera TaxID=906938 RepID=A0AAV8HRX4_9POAL|nr:Calcium-dependent lipid-binding (CaLB domain) family protein [Rhynchospora pubera]